MLKVEILIHSRYNRALKNLDLRTVSQIKSTVRYYMTLLASDTNIELNQLSR